MSRLSSIKEALININGAVFQELCDSFLSQKHPTYKAFMQNGFHETKQKTTIGSPDTWLQHANGNYLLMEATTREYTGRELVIKLKGDLLSCLDEEKTGIPIQRIEEIVLCYNSKLSALEMDEINQVVMSSLNIIPQHYNIESLALEIQHRYRNIANEYLKLPLDTFQIITLDQFIKESKSSKLKLTSPLDNRFFHRSDELNRFEQLIHTQDLVIIYGAAGVGKTKLALEGIKSFVQKNNEFNCYALSPKGMDILPDLQSYFTDDSSGILLVDDVNRVELFNQVLAHYKACRDANFKLVLTVRDYAFEELKENLFELKTDSVIPLSEFSFEEIKLILASESFQVTNSDFQLKIWEIGKGNARLSIMLALRALEMQSLDTFNNVLDLFDDYFSVYLKDNQLLKNKITKKVLGLLSFFYQLPISNTIFDSIELKFGLPKDSISNEVEKLHELDIVEIHNNYVTVSEQNVATYFFFKVFIEQELLSFEALWTNYFPIFKNRLSDSLNPCFTHFGENNVRPTVFPVLSNAWDGMNGDLDDRFNFLELTWYLTPEICLNFIQSQIHKSSPNNSIDTNQIETKYKSNRFNLSSGNERNLQMLSKFFRSEKHHVRALKISFDFVLHNPEHLPQLCFHIDGNYHIQHEDIKNVLSRHQQLIEFFELRLDKNKIIALTFIAIASQALKRFKWKYRSDEIEEKDDDLITNVKSLRKKIFDLLYYLSGRFKQEVIELYESDLTYHDANKWVYKFDLPLIVKWSNEFLDPLIFSHCFLIKEFALAGREFSFNHEFNTEIDSLGSSFNHKTYDLYEIIDWNRRKNRFNYEFENLDEFNELKRKDITDVLICNSTMEVDRLIHMYEEIIQHPMARLQSTQLAVEYIVIANISNDPEIGFYTFLSFVLLQNKHRGYFISYQCIEYVTKTSDLVERFWNFIESKQLSSRWKLDCILSIPDKNIKKKHINRLLAVFKKVDIDIYNIQLEKLNSFIKIQSKIVSKLFRLIYENNINNEFKVHVRGDSFLYLLKEEENLDLIKEAYLQQEKIDDHFDRDGSVLSIILKQDFEFILRLVNEIKSKESDQGHSNSDHLKLMRVWEFHQSVATVENLINLDLIDSRFGKCFSINFLQHDHRYESQIIDFSTQMVKKYSNSPDVLNFIINSTHENRGNQFESVFRAYLENHTDIETFKKVKWTKDQILFSGNDNVDEIRGEKWIKIKELVSSAPTRLKSIEILTYLEEKIDYHFNPKHQSRRNRSNIWAIDESLY